MTLVSILDDDLSFYFLEELRTLFRSAGLLLEFNAKLRAIKYFDHRDVLPLGLNLKSPIIGSQSGNLPTSMTTSVSERENIVEELNWLKYLLLLLV